jgi:peroxiredoxin
MNRACWWIVDVLCRSLRPDERDAVCGDLAESGEPADRALCGVCGLVARRQAVLWKDWRPWLILIGLVVPMGVILTLSSQRTADGDAIRIWFYLSNWRWADASTSAFLRGLGSSAKIVGISSLALISWSWTVGFMLASAARRTIWSTGPAFLLVLLLVEFVGSPSRARDYSANHAPFDMSFYRIVLPLIIQTAMVLLPAFWGMRQGLRPVALPTIVRIMLWASVVASVFALLTQNSLWWQIRTWQLYPLRYPRLPSLLPLAVVGPAVYILATATWTRRLFRSAVLLVMISAIASAAEPPPVKAALIPSHDRKPAPEFVLKDAAGKTAKLRGYHGKILLLDFWATWCHGCKLEIPWFSEFQSKFGERQFRVVGVSMDEGGWNVLKPFLAATPIPYRMLLGDDATSGRYAIETLPDTFLIDRRGRLAATYRGWLVDRGNMEENIRSLLAER